MVFIAAGMGGGTGTGAAPIVGAIAEELGALTVGIVTTPFVFEGTRRRRTAQHGLGQLRAVVDVVFEGDPPFAERILRVAVGHGSLAAGNLDVGRRPPRGAA